MRQMVDDGLTCLMSTGSLEPFGRLLDQAWVAKQNLSDAVSNPEIQSMYNRGMRSGAWGGKLLGAGGGGFLLFCAPPEQHPRLRAAFAGQHQIVVSLGAAGASVIYSESNPRTKIGDEA
jgi:D-glycero-alpha-D-manno-heptose-7-phosphate kinase